MTFVEIFKIALVLFVCMAIFTFALWLFFGASLIIGLLCDLFWMAMAFIVMIICKFMFR